MNKGKDNQIESLTCSLLECIGEDVTRPGLKDTPGRVAKAWKEWTRGYTPFPHTITLFPTQYTGIIVRKQIPFASTCEHHLAHYSGAIDFGYIPDKKIIGISKIIRLIQHYAAKLTIQEELTKDLIKEFEEVVKPNGTIIKISAYHSCESSRGVNIPNIPTITFLRTGIFLEDKELAHQFHQLIS